MKKCSYCGLENSDDQTHCLTCHTDLNPGSDSLAAEPITPHDEQRFWERMTFKQFAALFMRLQAIWLLWYAFIDLTYLPGYIMHSYTGRLSLAPGAFRLILRILLHVAAGITVIRYAERMLNWLIKDWIRNQPPSDKSLPPATLTPSLPAQSHNQATGPIPTPPSET